MQKFLRFLMLAALFLPFALRAQTTVTIGDLSSASDNTYLPMNSLYDYSYTQQIYTADEIGMAGTINSITVWLYGNENLYQMPFNIYMLEVSNTEFATTGSWIPVTSADIVYSGSVTVHNTTDSAYTFTLDVPFTYTGMDNLLICFDNNTGQWKSGLNGKVFTADDNVNRAIYARRDGTDYDPTNMAGVTATAITAARNVIVLDITPSSGPTCDRPATFEASGVTAHEVTLTWAGTTAGNYQLEYKTADETTWNEIPLTVTTYTLSNLLQNTAYNARVKAICSTDLESGYRMANFTTLISCPAPTGLSVTNIATNSATLNWVGDAASYNVYEITPTGNNLVATIADTTYDLTGLTATTAYTFGVTAVCNDEESSLATITFNTACEAISLPYSENFASTSASRECWTLVSNNTANIGGTNGMGFVTIDGREALRFSSYSSASDYNQYGFSPLLDVSSSATNLNVTVVYATRTNDYLYFGYVTATDTVWNDTPYNTGSSSTPIWETETFVIPANATQLAVHYYGSYAYWAWIDSVAITEMTEEYCFPVNTLTASNITAHTATLTGMVMPTATLSTICQILLKWLPFPTSPTTS
jgi:hypothetical protein